jgi:hypothetical protein
MSAVTVRRPVLPTAAESRSTVGDTAGTPVSGVLTSLSSWQVDEKRAESPTATAPQNLEPSGLRYQGV